MDIPRPPATIPVDAIGDTTETVFSMPAEEPRYVPADYLYKTAAGGVYVMGHEHIPEHQKFLQRETGLIGIMLAYVENHSELGYVADLRMLTSCDEIGFAAEANEPDDPAELASWQHLQRNQRPVVALAYIDITTGEEAMTGYTDYYSGLARLMGMVDADLAALRRLRLRQAAPPRTKQPFRDNFQVEIPE